MSVFRIVLVALSCLAFAGQLAAQRINNPGEEAVHRVIVYLRADQIPEDAAGFAGRLQQPGSAGEALRESLAFPIAAGATVNVPPLPDGRQPSSASPRARLARYLTLEYPLMADLDQLLSRLGSDPRLGFVGNARGDAWSAFPREEHYFVPIGPPPPRQRQYYLQLNFEDAWDYTKGHAIVGAGDTGIEVGHEDLLGNLRPHQSWDFIGNDDDPGELGNFRGHGTHVSGILAADTNNSLGVAGTCWNCSLQMSRVGGTDQRVDAFTWMTGNGAQIVSLSGFEIAGHPNYDFPPGIPCATTPPPQQHPFCPLLEFLEDREVVFTVSSGNDRRRINFPANEPKTIAVGGTERSGEAWDDSDGPGCILNPPHGTFGWGDEFQCGTNFGPEQDFVAPAKMVLSTFFTNWQHNAPAGCSDATAGGTPDPDDPPFPNTFDPGGSFDPLGYDWCTGTSMSAPFMAGVFSLVRSSNPLLSVAEAKQVLVKTTSQGGSHNDVFGFGIPDTAAAVENVLGTVGGSQVQNRMTPMFSLFTTAATNYLYTTKPQVASAAVAGTLHELPTSQNLISYGSANAGSTVAGYSEFPLEPQIPSPVPVSSFWIFGSDLNPFDPGTPLVPLYRLSFTEACDPRDHIYTTEQAGIDCFTGQSSDPGCPTDWCPSQVGDQVFRLDGIEGYIFSQCPPGFTCNNPQDPGQPQCIHRRSSQVDFGHALVLERELGLPPYQTYTGTIGNSCIGYVFPNDDTDGDGLIDGFELALGTDPAAADSDCDGVADGTEYPIAGLPVSDPLDGSCAAAAIQFGTDTTDDFVRTVALSGFTKPIVVMGPPSFNGTQATTLRIRNVTSTGFQHYLQEWDYLDGSHVFETASYLVLESGESDLNGLQAQAGTEDVNHSWKTVVFSTPFPSAPVVLTQVASDREPAAVTTRVRNVTSTSFQVRLQEEQAADGVHSTEEVHFIAIEPGITAVAGSRMGVGTTGSVVTHNFFTINLGIASQIDTPDFIAHMQTTNGGDTAALRHRNLSSVSVEVKVEEEQSLDLEVNHLPEDVGYVVFR